MPPGGSPKHAPPIETTPCGQRKGRHTRSAYGLLEGMSNGPSGSVEAVHDGVTPPPRDEPSIHWNGDHKGDDEANATTGQGLLPMQIDTQATPR